MRIEQEEGCIVRERLPEQDPGAVDEGFDLAPARSARGEQTVRSILRSALEIIDEAGLGAASQEAIARKAGISQSTLRHYFPTRDELQLAIFTTQYNRHQRAMEKIVLDPPEPAAQRMQRMVSSHLDYIIGSSDAVAFEHYAFLTRNEEVKAVRDQWYGWLLEHYSALVAQINPEMDRRNCDTRAFQILTLCLGCWLTLGRSRPEMLEESPAALKTRIMALVDELAGIQETAVTARMEL